jgi:pyridoxamine 5'-phosphate oxidase
MLRACHDRIRRELAALDRLRLRLPENGCDAEARTVARNLLKYFDTAAPNHDADEECSLFPRLLAATGGSAAALVERLEAEHRDLAALWLDLRPDLAAIEAGQRSVLTPDLVWRVRTTYLSHLECEESLLFPLAAARLDAAALAAIGAEMAARRGAKSSAK